MYNPIEVKTGYNIDLMIGSVYLCKQYAGRASTFSKALTHISQQATKMSDNTKYEVSIPVSKTASLRPTSSLSIDFYAGQLIKKSISSLNDNYIWSSYTGCNLNNCITR
jgi:hypothetical protein